MTTTLLDRNEAAEYYYTYIDQVPSGEDIRRVLDTQRVELAQLLGGISEAKSTSRYAPDKWSIRQVVGHLSDTERLFVFRAMWFARGFESPLPSFDQDIAIASARFDERSMKDLVDELTAVREATVHFFRTLPDDAWARRGIASDKAFSVRALARITAGHTTHHLRILRERYL